MSDIYLFIAIRRSDITDRAWHRLQ